MIKQIKAFTINIIAGANVATVLLMLASGYADRIHPTEHQMLSNLGMLFPFFLLANLLFVFFWLTFKWKKLWIPILGYILVFSPICTYMPLNMTQEVPDGTIKIISYNVCQYSGIWEYKRGFDNIYNYLKRQQPDIVCLQEDTDSWRKYAFKKFKEFFPYNDTTLFRNNIHGINGVGIHTRFPILKKERIHYESFVNGSVAYYLNIEGDTVIVINNHLEGTHLSTEDRNNYKKIIQGKLRKDTAKTETFFLIEKLGRYTAKRSKEADAVHAYIEAHRQYPIIVCGDFNDNPISYARRTIAQGLKDCFVETGRGFGLSYNQKGFFFRIDHMMCSDAFEPYNCEIDNEMDASDHFPILCRLKYAHKP